MGEFFFSLTWLIPVFPFLAFLIIILFTQDNNKLSHSLSIGSMALSRLWVGGLRSVHLPHPIWANTPIPCLCPGLKPAILVLTSATGSTP